MPESHGDFGTQPEYELYWFMAAIYQCQGMGQAFARAWTKNLAVARYILHINIFIYKGIFFMWWHRSIVNIFLCSREIFSAVKKRYISERIIFWNVYFVHFFLFKTSPGEKKPLQSARKYSFTFLVCIFIMFLFKVDSGFFKYFFLRFLIFRDAVFSLWSVCK